MTSRSRSRSPRRSDTGGNSSKSFGGRRHAIPEEELKKSTTLYVGNLPYSMRERELEDLFGGKDKVKNVKVGKERPTGRSLGFGFVTFFERSHAEEAMNKFSKQDMNGRMLKVDWDIDLEQKRKLGIVYSRGPSRSRRGGPSRYHSSRYSRRSRSRSPRRRYRSRSRSKSPRKSRSSSRSPRRHHHKKSRSPSRSHTPKRSKRSRSHSKSKSPGKHGKGSPKRKRSASPNEHEPREKKQKM